MGCAERHFPAAGGERRVSGAVGGPRGRGGRRRRWQRAGTHAAPRPTWPAALPPPAAAARCPLTSGVSICCCLFILFLFLSELTGFITTEVVNELYVDDPDKDSGGKIDVSLNISLPNLHCELVGLDIQDEMGRHEVGHIDNSMKIPLNNGAGCRFEGQFSINKVPGNFHVSTHSATAQPQNPDMTHVIHKLSFGDTLQVQNVHGAFNALGGADRLTSNHLCHYRWDLHCCRHSGLLYLHSLGGLEEDPAGQDALTTRRPNGRGPRETASPASGPPSPPALLSGPVSGCIPKWGWGEAGGGSRFRSYLFSPSLI
uniref:Endoplasmic reticulum-Golgi intermediate compartment protein n=1 Tax=Felis catus TaxID=9685 RepID=A0ABI7YZX6_FELCA